MGQKLKSYDSDDYYDEESDFSDQDLELEKEFASTLSITNHHHEKSKKSGVKVEKIEFNPFELALGITDNETNGTATSSDKPELFGAQSLSEASFESESEASDEKLHLMHRPEEAVCSAFESSSNFAKVSSLFFSHQKSDAISNFSSQFSFFNFYSELSAKAVLIQPPKAPATKTIPPIKKPVAQQTNKPLPQSIPAVKSLSKPLAPRSITFAVLGHVDSGKSTLIGQLLCKTGAIDEKLMQKYRKESKEVGKETFEYAWALDESKEERQRGITKDINTVTIQKDNTTVNLIDCPGHKDFVPNAIHGIMQADAGLLVIDVSSGEFETGLAHQTKEHLLLLKSFGLADNLVIALNKADKIEWSAERLNEIISSLDALLETLSFSSHRYVPISALLGENLVSPIKSDSPCLFEHLVKVIPRDFSKLNERELRILVADVTVMSNSAHAIQGFVCQGVLHKKDKLLLLPGNEQLYVKAFYPVENDKKPAEIAKSGDSILIVPQNASLFDNSIERGSVLVPLKHSCLMGDCFEAELTTFDLDAPIVFGSEVALYIHGMELNVKITKMYSSKSIYDTQSGIKNFPRLITGNSVAIVEIKAPKPIPLDAFESVNQLGIFLLRTKGQTVAAGKVLKIKLNHGNK